MMEVKVYKQKVKHLLYEQENNIAELKAENMVRRNLCEHTNHYTMFMGRSALKLPEKSRGSRSSSTCGTSRR